jgi:hypothetical protein
MQWNRIEREGFSCLENQIRNNALKMPYNDPFLQGWYLRSLGLDKDQYAGDLPPVSFINKGMMTSLWPEKEYLFPDRAIIPPDPFSPLSQPILSMHDRESLRGPDLFYFVPDQDPPSF